MPGRLPTIESLVSQQIFSARAQRFFTPHQKNAADKFPTLSNLSFPSLIYQFVTGPSVGVVGRADPRFGYVVTGAKPHLYNEEVDALVFDIWWTKFMEMVKYRVPDIITKEAVVSYLLQVANFYAKYVSIFAGRVLGTEHDPVQLDMAEAGKNFWIADWYKDSGDDHSLDVVDSASQLDQCWKFLKDLHLPPMLQADLDFAFTPRKLSANPWSPYVGFCMTRDNAVRTLDLGAAHERHRRDFVTPVNGFVPSRDGYFSADNKWYPPGVGKVAPPSAQSLWVELSAFKNRNDRDEVHRILKHVYGESWRLSEPSISYSIDADFFGLWTNGGVVHREGGSGTPFMYPNSGTDSEENRYRVPLWVSTKITDRFVRLWTHGFGKSVQEVGGIMLANIQGGLSGRLLDNLPLWVYANPDPRERPQAWQPRQTLQVNEANMAIKGMFDECQLGWRRAFHLRDEEYKDLHEVGVVPENDMRMHLQFADVTHWRDDAWLQWAEVFTVPS